MKITKSHLPAFKKRCQYWIEYLGLRDWDILIIQEQIEQLASATCDMLQQSATITLNIDAEVQYDGTVAEWLDRTAFHEVCHIYINRLLHMQIQSAIPDYSHRLASDLDTAHHAIIHTMWSLKCKK
jgi:hypothetical protein